MASATTVESSFFEIGRLDEDAQIIMENHPHAKTTQQLIQLHEFADWDFFNVWEIQSMMYPMLRGLPHPQIEVLEIPEAEPLVLDEDEYLDEEKLEDEAASSNEYCYDTMYYNYEALCGEEEVFADSKYTHEYECLGYYPLLLDCGYNTEYYCAYADAA